MYAKMQAVNPEPNPEVLPADNEYDELSRKEKRIPVKTDVKGNNSCQNFVRRQFSRHLRIKTKVESQNKMVQTFITGNFFVNTSNIYAGELVE